MTQSGAWLNPYDYAEAWDYIILGGTMSPGLCVDCGGSNPRKWDKRDGTAQSGATIVYSGDGLAQFSAKIQIGWNPGSTRWGRGLSSPREQYAEWDTFKQLLRPPTEQNPNALDIYHPNLQLLPVPITSVVVEDVVGPVWVAPGVQEWEIKFCQYRPAKPASATPVGSKSNANGGAGGAGGSEPQDEYDQMIEDLMNQVNDLA